jgi:hypothetical protein
VTFIVAYAEAEQGTRPLLRIFRRCGPVSISYDTGLQRRVVHLPHAYQQNRREEEWLVVFEVNLLDRVNLLDSVQEFAQLAEGEGPFSLWPAVQETVIAAARAQVGEQDVAPRQHDVLPLGAGASGSGRKQNSLQHYPAANGSTGRRVCL